MPKPDPVRVVRIALACRSRRLFFGCCRPIRLVGAVRAGFLGQHGRLR